ncbi:MAG TPA: hypothetical protein VN442_00860 [Bryobacteraceae bacterium]|nr:hypothetical protein [Bryobacteraceae bacterium]
MPLLLASTGTCADSSLIPLPESARQRALTADTFVKEKLGIWQKRLRLSDWRIDVRLVHPNELKPKTVGNIHWDTPAKTAIIRVLSPSDYKLPVFDDILRDMEFTVVHELIHLQLSSLPRSDASRGAEERAVNQITEAFLDLDRRR